jgi:ABC-type polar amino acid transport system ATPase subunit
MTITRCLAAAGFVLALGAIPCTSAFADDAMKSDSMMMDCSTANDHLMKMMTPSSTDTSMMKPDASVDKNFMTATHAMMMHNMMMAKIEVKCGKDPKAKAEAQKLLDMMAAETEQEMEILREVP